MKTANCNKKIELESQDIAYLKSLGFEDKDMKQIEDACNISTFALFRKGIDDENKIITNVEAMMLLEAEEFFSVVSRSAFHFSSSKIVPKTYNEFSISVDSGALFSDKPSKLNEYKQMDITYRDVKIMQNSPHLYAKDIHCDYVVEIPYSFWEELNKYDYYDKISDYLSDVVGLSQGEFLLDCNYSLEELTEKYDYIVDELYDTRCGENVEALKGEKMFRIASQIMEAEEKRTSLKEQDEPEY